MKLLPLTPAQASFVEIEIVGRYEDDEDPVRAQVAAIVAEHLERSNGVSLAVPDSKTLGDMLLDAINHIDDAIEHNRLEEIGGVDTRAQARSLHRTGEALWRKVSRMPASFENPVPDPTIPVGPDMQFFVSPTQLADPPEGATLENPAPRRLKEGDRVLFRPKAKDGAEPLDRYLRARGAGVSEGAPGKVVVYAGEGGTGISPPGQPDRFYVQFEVMGAPVFVVDGQDLDKPRTARPRRPSAAAPVRILEHPATKFYDGKEGYLVRTALVRADNWDGGANAVTIASDEDIAKLCGHLAYADVEHLVIVAMSNQAKLIAIHETSIGGASSAQLELRQALKVPLLCGAGRVAMVHNHPGGVAWPSPEDLVMTKTVHAAFKCLGIDLVDHVIVAQGGHYSFFTHGHIPK
jgi:DNA repair protein RadC